MTFRKQNQILIARNKEKGCAVFDINEIISVAPRFNLLNENWTFQEIFAVRMWT